MMSSTMSNQRGAGPGGMEPATGTTREAETTDADDNQPFILEMQIEFDGDEFEESNKLIRADGATAGFLRSLAAAAPKDCHLVCAGGKVVACSKVGLFLPSIQTAGYFCSPRSFWLLTARSWRSFSPLRPRGERPPPFPCRNTSPSTWKRWCSS